MKTFCATILLLVCLPLVAGAQGLGDLVGGVTDPSGSSTPAAAVTLRDTGTGAVRTAVTSADGLFAFLAIRPAIYDLTVTAPGFRGYAQKGIVVRADESVTVNV